MATAETLTDSDFMAPAAAPVTGPALTDADFHGEQSQPNISAPPVPQVTTLLSDKNIVVGHPMDMSHDQVNDAIQTQIYGRPRIDWHWGASTPTEKQQNSFLLGASLAPKDLWEIAKGGVRGVEGAVTGLAGLLKWQGETIANQPDEDMEAVGKALAGVAGKAISFIKARQENGFEAPDPEVFRGSFVSNPSFTRLAANLSKGLPALAAASALTIGTGNPLAGAGALGLIGAGEQYESAREFGSTPEKAGKTAIASGIGNTLLMELPLGKVLSGFGQEGLQSAARGAAEFAGISGIMTPFNNIVAKIGGDSARKLFDGMAESIISAFATGGILGSLTPGRGAEIDGLIQDAHKAGVPAKDIDAARAEIAKQMVENPDAVMGAIKNVAVYNDIKDQLSAIPKPEGMTPEEWNQNIDSGAKLWSARVTAEAQRRGLPAEEVYAGMRPRIEAGQEPAQVSEGLPVPGTLSPTETNPGSTSEAPQDNLSRSGESSSTVFPPTKVSSIESIANHPDFINLTDDATDIVNHYAQVRGVKPTREFSTSLFREMHDRLGELMRGTPEERAAAKMQIEKEFPDIQREFQVLKDKAWADTNEEYLKKSVVGFYGEDRIKGQLRYDKQGIPVRRPGSVVATVQTPEGETVKITHQMVMGQAEGMFDQAMEKRNASDPLGQFIIDNGGVRGFKSGAEKEEFKGVDIRFRGRTQLDEMAQRAYEHGLLEDPSSDLLRERLKDISTKGGVPRLADFYADALHQLKEHYSTNEYESPETEVAPGIFFQKGKPPETDMFGNAYVPGAKGEKVNPNQPSLFDEQAKPRFGLPKQEKEVSSEGKEPEQQSLFQGEALPRGTTRFTPEGAVISLMKSADASTFLHESAHVWLKDIHDFIQSGKANETYLKDWSTLKDWLKVEDGQERITTDQHETFARGFESYLREGQAPTEGLKGTFERFRQWLVNIYKNAQELKVELSPDIRQVMDSMLDYSKGEGQYVKNRPFDVTLGKNDKATVKNLIKKFVGLKNEQIVRGNQLADEVRQMVPNKTEREGIFWYKAAQGDMNVLAEALNEPKLAAYHDQIKAAMDLSPKAIEALRKINQYYEEAGAVSKEIGTIGNVRENYQNRIYAPEPTKDFVKTEVNSGLKQATAHAKARVFDTEFEGAIYKSEKFGPGFKAFATTDVADALSIHNEEMARANTSVKLAEAMVDAGLAAWKKDIPDGWEQVGSLAKRVPIKDKNGEAVIGEDGNQVVSHSALVAPKGIAKGLAAIADPNFIKQVDILRSLQQYQGLVKTVDLSFSFFHHFTMGMQALYQGGVRALLNAGTMNDQLHSSEFKDNELDFALANGMTSMVEANQDILRNLVQKNDDFFSKTVNLPVVRNILSTADKSSELLFGKIQRYLKVTDYAAKVANWVASHPDATNAEVFAAKQGFAKEVNAAYGGLNWEAMGITKSNLSLLRLALLAPDWSISNYQLLKYAVGDSGTAGQASRSHIITALVGGMVLTEGLNKILTGHFTDENKPGHALEVEISPNVYVSLLRGGIGDITKFASMVTESGAAGAVRFEQGKLSPFARTEVGLAGNVQYTGRPIAKRGEGPVANTYDVLKYILSSAAPMPLGVYNFFQYMQERDRTPQGAAAVLTGLGRYSKSGHNTSKLKM